MIFSARNTAESILRARLDSAAAPLANLPACHGAVALALPADQHDRPGEPGGRGQLRDTARVLWAMTCARGGRFSLDIVEAPRAGAILETRAVYNVLLNGETMGRLTYNMSGFTGSLPLPNGGAFSPGEKAISTWKRCAAGINREARAAWVAYRAHEAVDGSPIRDEAEARNVLSFHKPDDVSDTAARYVLDLYRVGAAAA